MVRGFPEAVVDPKVDYKSTLNLPRTEFPMKADLAQLKAEHAKAHADRKAKLHEQINQLDSKIQAQLQNARDRRDALQRKAQAKVQVLKDKAAEARAKAS